MWVRGQRKCQNISSSAEKTALGLYFVFTFAHCRRVLAPKFQETNAKSTTALSIFINGLRISWEPHNILPRKCNCRYATLASVSRRANAKRAAGCNAASGFGGAYRGTYHYYSRVMRCCSGRSDWSIRTRWRGRGADPWPDQMDVMRGHQSGRSTKGKRAWPQIFKRQNNSSTYEKT